MLRTCFAFSLFIGLTAPVAASSPDPKSLSIPSDELSKSRDLVKQLGSEQFNEREEAELALAKMGRLARPALLEGVNSDPNAEVRSRCSTLLPKATALEMKARMDVFLADVEGKYDHDLPGWHQFRSTIRNDWSLLGYPVWSDRSLDKAARGVFVELISTPANRSVIMAAGGSQSDLGQIVAARRQELYFQKYPRPIGIGGGGLATMVRRDPTVEDMAALLFGESQVPSHFVPRTISIAVLMTASGFNAQIQKTDDKGKVYRAIAIAWLESRRDPIEMYTAMTTASTMNLPQQTVRLAVRLFTTPGAQVFYRGNAAATLARLGGKEHVPMLESIFEDNAILTTIRRVEPGGPGMPNKIVNYEIQLRDVALGVAIVLTGQNHEEYGFVDQFKANAGAGVGYNYTRYYLSEEKRKDAFEKWKAWREKQEPKK